MENLEYMKYVFLFGRLGVFALIVIALIAFGVILIIAAKKRREKRAEAFHQLFNPDDRQDDGVSVSLDNSSDYTSQNDGSDLKL